MTGKRFVQNTNLVMQNNEVYVVCGDEHSADVVTTALNELINENEQLKSRIKELEIMNKAQSDAIDGLQETICHLDLSELNGDVE